MRTKLVATFAIALSLGTAGVARAATLKVGPAESTKKICDAVAVAAAGDVIEIAPGDYTDSCEIKVANLTLRGVGGRPKIDLSGTDHPYFHQGMFMVSADGATFENLEMMGTHVTDAYNANAAAIRIHAKNVTVRSCFIHHNNNGIQGGTDDGSPAGTLTIEYSEFSDNAVGNGCNAGGCTHNIYATGSWDKVVARFNYFHSISGEGAPADQHGHLFKSRAKQNFLLYNRISGEDGYDSYAVNMPNGGLGVLLGNVIQKGGKGGNRILVAYGEEGLSNPDKRLFVINNTMVNDAGSGTFIRVPSGVTVSAHNNILFGAGTAFSEGTLPVDNLIGTDPMFVDAAKYDFHLAAGSPAKDKGVAPGSADTFSLVPDSEYVHPLKSAKRLDDGTLDLGAFEIGSDPTKPPVDAGGGPDAAPTPDAAPAADGGGSPDAAATDAAATTDGAPAADDALSPDADPLSPDAGSPDGGDPAATDAGAASSGCSCRLAPPASAAPASLVGLGLGLLLLARRRKS